MERSGRDWLSVTMTMLSWTSTGYSSLRYLLLQVSLSAFIAKRRYLENKAFLDNIKLIFKLFHFNSFFKTNLLHTMFVPFKKIESLSLAVQLTAYIIVMHYLTFVSILLIAFYLVRIIHFINRSVAVIV